MLLQFGEEHLTRLVIFENGPFIFTTGRPLGALLNVLATGTPATVQVKVLFAKRDSDRLTIYPGGLISVITAFGIKVLSQEIEWEVFGSCYNFGERDDLWGELSTVHDF